MKVNLNVAFKDAFGNEIKENGKEVIIRDQVASILFGGNFLERDGKASNESKLLAYKLSLKVAGSEGEFEITAEDAVMIKNAASMLSAGAFGQICELVEG